MRVHVMAVVTALICCAIVAYAMFEHDIPRRFFYHGLECSGNIGGGCEKL